MGELYRWEAPSCPRAVHTVSIGLLHGVRGVRGVRIDPTYRGGDGSIVRRRALSGEVDAVGSLELDLELGCAVVSMRNAPPGILPDLRQRGRSPC